MAQQTEPSTQRSASSSSEEVETISLEEALRRAENGSTFFLDDQARAANEKMLAEIRAEPPPRSLAAAPMPGVQSTLRIEQGNQVVKQFVNRGPESAKK